jgi:hypothetical protein
MRDETSKKGLQAVGGVHVGGGTPAKELEHKTDKIRVC